MVSLRRSKRARTARRSPALDTRDASTGDTVTSAQSASLRAARRDAAEKMYRALSSGAILFLELRDVAAALATCRSLRSDAALAVAALSRLSVGRHLLHGCAGDWSFMPPPGTLRQLHVELFRGTCSSCSDDSEGVNHALVADQRIARGGVRATQLLSLVGMLERYLLPLCYDPVSLNGFGDACAARPVLLPLLRAASDRDNYDGGDDAPHNPIPWTPDDVRDTLNATWNLLGDEFTSAPSAFVRVSEVGAHWENIVVPERAGKSSCRFCDTAKKCVREYKKEANVMLRKFNEVLSAKKRKWRAEGFDAEEIHQKRSELKAKFFPEDSYPDVNFADSHDDDILADICESERFPMDPFDGMAAGFDRANDDVFNALSEQQMELCRSLYQPLKVVLTKHLAFVGQRVHRTWMDDDDGSVTSELLAGVSASGFLCGVFIMVNRAESEIPPSAVLDDDLFGEPHAPA
ncbi:hypothetical protein PybrP1_007229 [[Pythium] brassicae (nom. inval.)]|nr:hypothetical protein PybrP1_007229 [[Pythium] brassicae (nom. inval.)]